MKIRVLHVIQNLGPGGVEQRRLLLAKYLDRSRFEQKIICTETQGPLADAIRELGFEVIVIGQFRSIFNVGHFRRVISVIKNFRPHIIHGAVFEGVTLATVSGFLGRVPIVIAEETSDPQNRTWRGNLLFRSLTKLASYVVGVSPSVIEYLKSVKVPERKIRLVTNGVEVPTFTDENLVSDIKTRLGICEGDFVVGSVGRLRDFHKRFSDLIAAVSLLRPQVPNIKLLIVGDGEDRQMLKELAVEKGVEDCVIFAGFQFDTDPYYKCMHIFALASHMEAFGLVLAEAMFFKLPVVASNVGGMRFIVVPDETGYLVPRHEPQSFANAILKLYRDPLLRSSMGLRGHKRAIEEYSAEAYVDRVEKLYVTALSSLK